MTIPRDPEIDWTLTTWKGARRQQHQEFHPLPFTRKLATIVEMNRAGSEILESRRRQGSPYIDPYTGERTTGSLAHEEPPNE